MPANRKLGRKSAHRKSMLRGMVTYLLENGQIETTYTRAKEVGAVTDSMITLGKKGTLAAYRSALAYITKEDVAKKLFDTIAPSYEKLSGGYTQIFKLGPRRGDGADMALIRLVAVEEAAPVVEEKKPAKKTAAKKKAAPVEEVAPVVEEAPVEEAPAEEAPAEEAAAE